MSLESCLKQIRSNETIQSIRNANGIGSNLYRIEKLQRKHRNEAVELLSDAFAYDNDLFKHYQITKKELMKDMGYEVDDALSVKDSLSYVIVDVKTNDLVAVSLFGDVCDLIDFENTRAVRPEIKSPGFQKYYALSKKMDEKRKEANSEVCYDGSIKYKRGDIIVNHIQGRSMKYKNVKESKFHYLLVGLPVLIGKMKNYKRYWGYNEHSTPAGMASTFCCNVKEAFIANSFLIDNKFMANDFVICYDHGLYALQNINNDPKKIGQYYQYLIQNSKRKLSKL